MFSYKPHLQGHPRGLLLGTAFAAAEWATYEVLKQIISAEGNHAQWRPLPGDHFRAIHTKGLRTGNVATVVPT